MSRAAVLVSLASLLVACAPRSGGHGTDGGLSGDAAAHGDGAAATDGSTTADADACACHDVGGSGMELACGGSGCIAGSNWTCSDGMVRGLAIRTGVCMDAGTPPDAGSGACAAACSACGSGACDECNTLATTATASDCTSEHAAFASCLAGACTDVAMCLDPFSAFAGCACPFVSTRLHTGAAACGATVPYTCADALNQTEMLGCDESYQRMGCAAFSTSACGGG